AAGGGGAGKCPGPPAAAKPHRRPASARRRRGHLASYRRPRSSCTRTSLPDLPRLLEGEAGPARAQRGRIAVSHIAQKVRANAGAGEKLPIDASVVEARHGSCVEAERAGGHYEIGPLQRAVACAIDACCVRLGGEPPHDTLTLGRVGKKTQTEPT